MLVPSAHWASGQFADKPIRDQSSRGLVNLPTEFLKLIGRLHYICKLNWSGIEVQVHCSIK